MNQAVLDILRECDALLEGHFKYTSGRHGRVYFEKIRIAGRPDLVMELGRMTAELWRDGEFDLVCAPAFGAIVFGFATALCAGRSFAFLQRGAAGEMTIRPGFQQMLAGSRVLLVEDVVTTGGSVMESIEAVEKAGATVMGVSLLVDRTDGAFNPGVPCRSLLSVSAESWPPEECPMCAAGVPVSVPGSSGKPRGSQPGSD